MDPRTTLLTLLASIAYQFSPDKPFRLASGKLSDEYLDCKLALSEPAAMAAMGATILKLVESNAVAIGGLTMGADPIAMSTSQASAGAEREVRWFTVRKTPKEHGRKKLVEGRVNRGDRVVVVDDVVTSGQSTVQAIRACRDEGLQIVQVIVLVDREESDGLANIEREVGPGVPIVSVFKKSEIKDRWRQLNQRSSTYPATA